MRMAEGCVRIAGVNLYGHACGPPDEDCQLDPQVDYEAIDPAPADD